MYGHPAFFDMPYHPVVIIDGLMKSFLEAQGKTPISRQFENVVMDYYRDKLLASDTYAEFNSTRKFLIESVRTQIEKLYPSHIIKDLLANEKSRHTVHERQIGYVRIKYFDKDGKKVDVDCWKLFSQATGMEVKGLYVISNSEQTVIDATEHSEKIQAAVEMAARFKDDIEELKHEVSRILSSFIAIEDVLEVLPELKTLNFEPKEKSNSRILEAKQKIDSLVGKNVDRLGINQGSKKKK